MSAVRTAEEKAAALLLRKTLERVAVQADPEWWRQHPTAALVRLALRRAKLAGIAPSHPQE